MKTRYLSAEKRTHDDFQVKLTNKFGEVIYDAKMAGTSAWAMMTHASFLKYGDGRLGTGYGQKYSRDENGHLVKAEG